MSNALRLTTVGDIGSSPVIFLFDRYVGSPRHAIVHTKY